MKNTPISLLGIGALVLMGAGCLSASGDPTPAASTQAEEDLLAAYERNLAGIVTNVNDPTTVSVGDTFTFGVEIQNTQNEERSLRSIDIDRAFLTGFEITNISYERSDEYYVESINQDIFEFNTTIEKNGTLEVVFTATATKAGEFGGDFDICIDNDINCVFESIDVVIE